jgi:hypothetical protein
MDFVLYYKGRLVANADKKQKAAIRQSFHPQLRTLWSQEPLRGVFDLAKGTGHKEGFVRAVAGRDVVFLVSSVHHTLAELDILMLRHGEAGSIVSGGDIDNRLKTLFDALRVPTEAESEPGSTAEQSEPVYCLLEDDRLISAVRVETHQLLTGEGPNEVALFIRVKTKVTRQTWSNFDF